MNHQKILGKKLDGVDLWKNGCRLCKSCHSPVCKRSRNININILSPLEIKTEQALNTYRLKTDITGKANVLHRNLVDMCMSCLK